MSEDGHGSDSTAYRLPADAHVGVVRLQVSDLSRSLAFYEGLLGFRVLERSTERAVLGGADGERLLELNGTATTRVRLGRLGLYHFAVLLPDRASLGRLLAHLLRAGVQPGAADHLVSEALYLQDPDDLGIELYRDRPRGEWSSSGSEIAMASDPLDAGGLLAAGGTDVWDGLPAGTTIGHVHLHVGSIDAARAFYHDALGFAVTVSGYPGALFMSAGGYHHHLGVNTWAGSAAKAPGSSEPRLLDWELVLPTAADAADAVESLARAGHSAAAQEPGADDVADPWGSVVRIVTASRQQ